MLSLEKKKFETTQISIKIYDVIYTYSISSCQAENTNNIKN